MTDTEAILAAIADLKADVAALQWSLADALTYRAVAVGGTGCAATLFGEDATGPWTFAGVYRPDVPPTDPPTIRMPWYENANGCGVIWWDTNAWILSMECGVRGESYFISDNLESRELAAGNGYSNGYFRAVGPAAVGSIRASLCVGANLTAIVGTSLTDGETGHMATNFQTQYS